MTTGQVKPLVTVWGFIECLGFTVYGLLPVLHGMLDRIHPLLRSKGKQNTITAGMLFSLFAS